MAELHIIGQILKAVEFEERHIYCKWSLQFGSSWKLLEGEGEGQTFANSNRFTPTSEFAHPLDIHLATASVQGWPKLYLEVHAVNILRQSWPVGYGFVHLPTSPGTHRLVVSTWKVAPTGWIDWIKEKFGGGGIALSKPDLVYTGLERYKLKTNSSGKIIIDVALIFRNFSKYGIEF